jgi:serine/threonine protein kinase
MGLHAAHELHDEQGNPTGLVHRDVSPQNILVGLDGVTRISDFGVARARTRLGDTRAGQLKGKIAYMAPEQAAGDELLDRRADVFAAGIVLWELLTGKRLFRASNDAATLSRVVSERISAPTDVVLGLDPGISDACMRALERSLSRRIASAAEFADMLESAATRAGVQASGRDVGAYMASVLGEEIRRHRDAIRRWLSECEDSEVRSDAVSARVPTSGPMRRVQFSAEPERFPSSPRSASACVDDGSDLTVVAPRHSVRRLYLLGATIAVLLVVVGATLLSMPRELPTAVRWSHWPKPPRIPDWELRRYLDGANAFGADWRRGHGTGEGTQSTSRNSLKEPRKGSRPGADPRTPLMLPRVSKPQVDLTNPYTR